MKSKKQRRWISGGVITLLLLFLLMRCRIWNEGQTVAVTPQIPLPAADADTQRPERPISVAGLSATSPQILTLTPQQKIQKAFERLAAGSYTSEQWIEFIGIGLKVNMRLYRSVTPEGEMLRRETSLFLKRAGAENFESKTTEITNPEGHWEIKNLPGTEDVAFQVRQSDGASAEALSMSRTFQMLFNSVTNLENANAAYAEQSGFHEQRPVTIICRSAVGCPEAGTRYTLDEQTGDLVSVVYTTSSMSAEMNFKIESSQPPKLFEISKDRIAVPTDNVIKDLLEIDRLARKIDVEKK